MRTNTKTSAPQLFTHNGGKAANISPEQALRRSVMSCFLWEKEFYEDGVKIADRILDLSSQVSLDTLVQLAVDARTQGNLRHAPLLLLTALVTKNHELAKKGKGNAPLVTFAIESTVKRADELAELLAMYWKDGRKPLARPLKLGLARAFKNFDEYQLAKYNRPNDIRLKDVMRLVHPKPDNILQSALWERLLKDELKTPDTWEVELSAGKDKRETFERLLRERKLGYMALLRNLRNMDQAKVDPALVREAILARKGGADRVLPFRFIAAARAAPTWAPHLDEALKAGVAMLPVLKGKTAVLVDVSGSMDARLSGKSDLTRVDAAAALASVINAEAIRVFSFSNALVEVQPYRGLAGIQMVVGSQSHGGTELARSIEAVNQRVDYDRIIVVTDEQANSGYGRFPAPRTGKVGYMINTASARNGVGYGPWVHIDGFSESVLRFISEVEG